MASEGTSGGQYFPQSVQEFSSNWRTLQKSIVSTNPDSKKRKRLVNNDNKLSRQYTRKRQKFDHADRTTGKSEGNNINKNSAVKMHKGVEKPAQSKQDEKRLDEKTPQEPGRLQKPNSFTGLTHAIAIDCEMVGVGEEGKESILGRVSIVNQFGYCVYDNFVKPTERVTDYRTAVSGCRPEDLKHGKDFKTVQEEVYNILNGRLLVGHAIRNDLEVLALSHPKKHIRDTQKYREFRALFKGRYPSLKKLADQVLNVKVQEGEHSSIQDAQAAMRLYTLVKHKWEKEIKENYKSKKAKRSGGAQRSKTNSLDSDRKR